MSEADGIDRTLPDRQGAFSGGLWNVAQTVGPMLATLGLSVVMGRVLGPADLGKQSWIAYLLSLSWAIVVWPLVTAGIQTLSTARGGRDSDLVRRLSVWTLRLLPPLGLVVGVILLGIGAEEGDRGLWAIAAATAAANSLAWALAIRVISSTGWSRVSRFHTVSLIAAQLVAIAGVFLGFGIAGVLTATLVEAVVFAVAMRLMSRERQRGPAGPVPRVLVRIWGQQLGKNSLSEIVGQRVEFLFLGLLSTTTELAMYSIPFMLVSAAASIPYALMRAAMPAMAARSGAGHGVAVEGHLSNACRVTVGASIPLAAATAAAGPVVVRLLYGPAFQQAVNLVLPMSALLVVLPVAFLLQTYWESIGELKAVLWVLLTGSILDIALALLLIPPLGAWGAVAATVAAQSLTAALVIGFSVRRVPGLSVGDRRWVLTVLVAAAAAAPSVLLLLSGAGVVLVLVAAAGSILLITGFGLVVGWVGPQDAAWLHDTLPARARPLVPLLIGRAQLSRLQADGR
jgi:O-antigen/teichoic acid export membrane protein